MFAMSQRRSFLMLSALAAALLAGCSNQGPRQTPPAAALATVAAQVRPKLVVFIAIVGLHMRHVLDNREQFAPDASARWARRW